MKPLKEAFTIAMLAIATTMSAQEEIVCDELVSLLIQNEKLTALSLSANVNKYLVRKDLLSNISGLEKIVNNKDFRYCDPTLKEQARETLEDSYEIIDSGEGVKTNDEALEQNTSYQRLGMEIMVMSGNIDKAIEEKSKNQKKGNQNAVKKINDEIMSQMTELEKAIARMPSGTDKDIYAEIFSNLKKKI